MKKTEEQLIQPQLDFRNPVEAKAFLEKMEDADVASFLSQQESLAKLLIPYLIQENRLARVIVELPEEKIKSFLKEMSQKQLDELFCSTQVDELVYILQFIDEEKRGDILSRSPQKNRMLRFLEYSENQVGRIMQSPVFALTSSTRVAEGIEKLRKESLENFVFYVYCVDDQNRLEGVVSMRELVTAQAGTLLKDIIKKNVISVSAHMTTDMASKVVAHYDFLSLPVVDDNHHLLGVITMDDIIDIIQERNKANIYATAGLHLQESIHTSPWKSIQNRLPWMGLNLFLAILASSVISLFEQTMSRLIILASLKNIVASMGGNTAIQTLTVTTRGMATGDFRFTPFTQALLKEVIVGFVMGVIMGLGSAIITYFWKGSLLVSTVIFIAMVLNFIVAVIMGSVIPIVLNFLKRDPAVGSGILVTIITDIFGFFIFLGVAHYGLSLFGASL